MKRNIFISCPNGAIPTHSSLLDGTPRNVTAARRFAPLLSTMVASRPAPMLAPPRPRGGAPRAFINAYFARDALARGRKKKLPVASASTRSTRIDRASPRVARAPPPETDLLGVPEGAGARAIRSTRPASARLASARARATPSRAPRTRTPKSVRSRDHVLLLSATLSSQPSLFQPPTHPPSTAHRRAPRHILVQATSRARTSPPRASRSTSRATTPRTSTNSSRSSAATRARDSSRSIRSARRRVDQSDRTAPRGTTSRRKPER